MRRAALRAGRRQVIAGAAAALATPGIVLAQSGEQLVVNAYGGEFQEVFIKTTVEPFEKKFGVKVIYDDAGSAAEDYAKIRASRGAPGFDVAAELTPPEIFLGARERLLEPLTEREVPNLRHVWAKSRSIIPNAGLVHTYQYTALIWNKKTLEKPDSWADYWNPSAKYGDRVRGRVLNHHPNNLLAIYALIMGAKLKGGGVDNLEPGFAMLRDLKPFIGATVQTSAASVPYFENEQVWLSPFWSARAAYYESRDYPFGLTIPKEGTIGLANCGAVPVGARNKKLAFEFLNFRLDADVQRAFNLAYFSSPGRPDISDWPESFKATQITTEAQMNAIEFPDSEVIGQRRRDWTRRWQEVMA
jgi:putative spermidine/putrescine transport system substrate-binding protein